MIINCIRSLVSKIKHLRVKSLKKTLGSCSKHVDILPPYHIAGVSNVFIGDYVHILPNCTILATDAKLIIKRYVSISYNFCVTTSNHTPTVGIPSYFNNRLHINECVKGDIIIEDDVWIGMNVTLLPGAHVGRGAIIGAGAIISKEILPYSIVVGNPNKIIGTRFTKAQILQHEKLIYKEDERYSEDYLDGLFVDAFANKRAIGTTDISDAELVRFNNCVNEMHYYN